MGSKYAENPVLLVNLPRLKNTGASDEEELKQGASPPIRVEPAAASNGGSGDTTAAASGSAAQTQANGG